MQKCGVVEVLLGPNELGRLIRDQQQRGDGGGRRVPPQAAPAASVVGSAALLADARGHVANNQGSKKQKDERYHEKSVQSFYQIRYIIASISVQSLESRNHGLFT